MIRFCESLNSKVFNLATDSIVFSVFTFFPLPFLYVTDRRWKGHDLLASSLDKFETLPCRSRATTNTGCEFCTVLNIATNLMPLSCPKQAQLEQKPNQSNPINPFFSVSVDCPSS